MQIHTGWTQRIARTQAIMSAAWQILWEDKTLLLLPIASSASLMLLTASFAVPAILGALTGASMTDGLQELESWSYVGMFLFYVVTYGVAIFFNAALAICVLRKLEGKQTTILDGLREALSCFPQILGWALVSATIGVVLKTIERRSGFVGSMVARVLGLAWTVATFLVVPVLVAERKGPLEAIQASVQLLRRTWGEDLLAGLGFGLLYFFWAIPGVFAFVIGAGMIATHPILAIAIMVLAILYFPLLGLVLSTMSTIFDVVLYRYASTGTITPGFDRELLDASFVTKST
ncbi:MAG: DUF6159 family protein [Nitrospirota bacterium]|nr:DUF6159 family protein [Nitrospirota bacterium]